MRKAQPPGRVFSRHRSEVFLNGALFLSQSTIHSLARSCCPLQLMQTLANCYCHTNYYALLTNFPSTLAANPTRPALTTESDLVPIQSLAHTLSSHSFQSRLPTLLLFCWPDLFAISHPSLPPLFHINNFTSLATTDLWVSIRPGSLRFLPHSFGTLRSFRKSQSSRLQQLKYQSKTRTQFQANFTTTKSLPTASNRISVKLTTIHASSIDTLLRSSIDLVPVLLSTINRSITTLCFSQQ